MIDEEKAVWLGIEDCEDVYGKDCVYLGNKFNICWCPARPDRNEAKDKKTLFKGCPIRVEILE